MKTLMIFLAVWLMAAPMCFAAANPAKQYETQRGTEPPVDGVWHVYDRKGNLLREENYKNYRLDGEMKIFYPSGSLKEQLFYVDSQRVGPDKTYYENGGFESEGAYENNDLEGLSTSYYDTGEVESQSYYSNGNLDGDKKSYYKNGVLKQTVHYNAGVKDGTSFIYNPEGQVIGEDAYMHGALVSHKDYGSETILSVKSGPALAKPAEPVLSDSAKADNGQTTSPGDQPLSKPQP